MKKNKFDAIYNDQYFFLWEMTMGQGGSLQDIYKGAILFSNFILSEIKRYKQVQEYGEVAIERRGLVSPKYIIKVWAYEILSECHRHRIVPPWELCQVIYNLLHCRHEDGPKGKIDARNRFHSLLDKNPNMSIRQASKKVGVDHRTGRRWKAENSPFSNNEDEIDYTNWPERYTKISELTKFQEYFPIKARLMDKKLREDKEKVGHLQSN